MLPTEKEPFFDAVSYALALYTKSPDERELNVWWAACKHLSLDDCKRFLKSHEADSDDGKRAPRPIDITRRAGSAARDGQGCAASDPTGRCQYPGIFSDGTSGEGPWYCPWHRSERSGPEASRWIEVSREVPYEVARAKRVSRMNADAQQTAVVVNLAHAIALRHGAKPWQPKTTFSVPGMESEASE